MDWSFASDNAAGAHPRVVEAIAAANDGAVHAYGDDPATASAIAAVRDLIGDHVTVALVATGTAANVLGLAHVLRPYDAVICPDTSHLANDESTAPGAYGLTLIPVATVDGKLRPEDIEARVHVLGDPHSPQPRAVSITQTTELGRVYSVDEVRALADAAHAHGLILHVDGARIANAVAALNTTLRELIAETGVDLLSLGLTKDGALQGEAIVILRPDLAEGLVYTVKRGMQLLSKQRLVAAQMTALLADDLWLDNARHANAMARRLADGFAGIDGIELAQPVDASHVFVTMTPAIHVRLSKRYAFYEWQTVPGTHRFLCSWSTTPNQVDALIACAAG
jgi:threonine aldolase